MCPMGWLSLLFIDGCWWLLVVTGGYLKPDFHLSRAQLKLVPQFRFLTHRQFAMCVELLLQDAWLVAAQTEFLIGLKLTVIPATEKYGRGTWGGRNRGFSHPLDQILKLPTVVAHTGLAHWAGTLSKAGRNHIDRNRYLNPCICLLGDVIDQQRLNKLKSRIWW